MGLRQMSHKFESCSPDPYNPLRLTISWGLLEGDPSSFEAKSMSGQQRDYCSAASKCDAQRNAISPIKHRRALCTQLILLQQSMHVVTQKSSAEGADAVDYVNSKDLEPTALRYFASAFAHVLSSRYVMMTSYHENPFCDPRSRSLDPASWMQCLKSQNLDPWVV